MAGNGILSNGVTEILKGLSILVAKEISLAHGLKDELLKLKKTLDIILTVMDDAEKKQVKNEAVRMWLEELKDIAYEAEDILDERAYEVLHQSQLTRKRDKVSNYLSRDSNPIKLRLQIAHEIKDINKKLNEHAMQKNTLGLQMLELDRNSGPVDLDQISKLREVRETDSLVDSSSKIIGRDKDKDNIMKMLLDKSPCNQDGNIQVISIVGMGGVGKSTLAQLIFNDPTVENQFDLKIWVCVSDDFNVRNLFVKIIESITKKKCENVSNIDVIVCQLQQLLSGHKYLLVLDDVWNKNSEDWVRLKKPLLKGGSGSKILVTTRSEEVASIMGGELHSYKLEILNEDESWSFFKERAFGYVGGAVEIPTLTAIGKELVKKCGGLPIALLFLVTLLRNKDENKWRVINENKIWVKSYGEGETRILPILKLSYDHLPSHLKQCFSYFSLFPKNDSFLRIEMILFWIAEGFLPQPSGRSIISMEEVGNDCFNSLLHNSFFQNVKKDEFGQIESFSMHDLVKDLAKYVAGDHDCLILGAYKDMDSILNIRRLNLFVENEGLNFNEIMATFHSKSKLRTLLVSHTSIKKIESNAFDGVKRLRVLDLHDAPELEEISSSSMSNLKHLRHLDLSSTKVTNLPESVMSLYHLQTLDVRGCWNLKELPQGIGKLINLRHLYLPKDVSMPREIGQLNSLQTLGPVINAKGNNSYNKGFGVGGIFPRKRKEGWFGGIEILEGLNFLSGSIEINNLRNVKSAIDAQRANLKEKKNLNKIVLKGHADNSRFLGDENEDEAEAVLEAEPHSNLKFLSINDYYGVKLPQWMGDPSCLQSLTSLELSKCEKCEQVVGFGKLPSLKMLKLRNMDGVKCLGNEFYYNNSGGGGGEVVLFPSLKELFLDNLSYLEEWVDFISSPTTPTTISCCSCFPCLEKINISGCPNLRITPSRFPSLKILSLQMISERVAVPLITTNLNSLNSVYLFRVDTNLNIGWFLPHCLLQGSSNLKKLIIYFCDDFQGFDPNEEEEEGFTSLTVLLLLGLPAMKFLPDIQSFTSLEKLYIEDCESLKPIPEELTCLSSSLEHLKEVKIEKVKEVEDFKWEK